jgi:hydrogenase-4 membrane subunit HyfE
MSVELASRLIDGVGAMLLFTMFLILASGQLFRAIYAVAAQSVFLGIAGAILAAATGNVDLWIIAGVTIAIKAIALPWLLIRVVRRIQIRREIEPVIPIALTLAIAAGIVVLAFWLSASLDEVRQAITGNAMPVGIALILLGVLVMASRKKALTQMVGLFAAENGIFFTAMAVSQGMPLIVEIGVVLDVVLGALVMGVMVLRVRSSVDADIADLSSLKG